MAQLITNRDGDTASRLLKLPEGVVRHAVLPAARHSWPELRLTCRGLCRAVDASVRGITLREPIPQKLPALIAALPRMTGCASLWLSGVSDGGLAATAALALPRLTQLTALKIELDWDDRYDNPYATTPDPEEEPPLPRGWNGALVLAAQLGRLRRLEVFAGPQEQNAWGPVADALAGALARLPALRELRLGCNMSGAALRRPCDTLGADAWRSLEFVSVTRWAVESLAALAQAPLTRLTQLHLEDVVLGGGDPVCPTISGAVWAPQLRGLSLTLDCFSYEMLSDLRLPNLERLVLIGSYNDGWRSADSRHMRLTGWHLPKLRSLTTDAASVGNAAAASLAALRLPALTELCLSKALRPVLHGAVWATQLRSLDLTEPSNDTGRQEADRTKAWFAALAAAPLTALSHLSLGCYDINATNAAALGGAPWLRGLERAKILGLSEAAAAALRASCSKLAELEAAGQMEFVCW